MTTVEPSPAEHLARALSGAQVGEVAITSADGFPAPSLRPRSPLEIRHAIQLAARHGGHVAVTRRLRPGVLALDLSLMAQIDAPDERTCLVRCGAGAKVHEVEARAIQAGLTLGPLLPSSWNKTVGAWLAGPTRGERAIPPGRLETAALALEAVVPDGGFYRSIEAPRTATGPDLDHLLLGGEGRFGILTRATLRLAPRALVETAAARPAASALDALAAIRSFARDELAPAEARWDRGHSLVEARFTGRISTRGRRFGDQRLSGREIVRGHLELAGDWSAWNAITPLKPEAFQLVAITSEGAFGALEFATTAEAEPAAGHARAIGFTIVSPRRLRPPVASSWGGAASGILNGLEQAVDPSNVFGR